MTEGMAYLVRVFTHGCVCIAIVWSKSASSVCLIFYGTPLNPFDTNFDFLFYAHTHHVCGAPMFLRLFIF